MWVCRRSLTPSGFFFSDVDLTDDDHGVECIRLSDIADAASIVSPILGMFKKAKRWFDG